LAVEPLLLNKRSKATLAFLNVVLANGALPVDNVEARAREAGLLGPRQRITDAKTFRWAKHTLGISSRRDGIGRGGRWFWEIPSVPTTAIVETAGNDVPMAPVSRTDNRSMVSADFANEINADGAPTVWKLSTMRTVPRRSFLSAEGERPLPTFREEHHASPRQRIFPVCD
jgi:hypothetical protein